MAHWTCRGWSDAARAGRARVAPSGRLVVVRDNGSVLPSECPWCSAAFYMRVGGESILTLDGRRHRELSREAGAAS